MCFFLDEFYQDVVKPRPLQILTAVSTGPDHVLQLRDNLGRINFFTTLRLPKDTRPYPTRVSRVLAPFCYTLQGSVSSGTAAAASFSPTVVSALLRADWRAGGFIF